MMVILNRVVKEFDNKGRGGDTKGTRASGIAEEIVERFVVEAQESMNIPNLIYDCMA